MSRQAKQASVSSSFRFRVSLVEISAKPAEAFAAADVRVRRSIAHIQKTHQSMNDALTERSQDIRLHVQRIQVINDTLAEQKEQRSFLALKNRRHGCSGELLPKATPNTNMFADSLHF